MLKQTQEQLSRIVSKVKVLSSDTGVTIILDENDEQSFKVIREALLAEGYRNVVGVIGTMGGEKGVWVVGRFLANSIVVTFT